MEMVSWTEHFSGLSHTDTAAILLILTADYSSSYLRRGTKTFPGHYLSRGSPRAGRFNSGVMPTLGRRPLKPRARYTADIRGMRGKLPFLPLIIFQEMITSMETLF